MKISFLFAQRSTAAARSPTGHAARGIDARGVGMPRRCPRPPPSERENGICRDVVADGTVRSPIGCFPYPYTILGRAGGRNGASQRHQRQRQLGSGRGRRRGGRRLSSLALPVPVASAHSVRVSSVYYYLGCSSVVIQCHCQCVNRTAVSPPRRPSIGGRARAAKWRLTYRATTP